MRVDPLQLIYEGLYDPCIFKALFVIGGPGSGKSFVTRKLGLSHMGLVQLNSDYPLEKYMIEAGLDLKMPESESEQRTNVRDKAKRVIKSKENTVLDQRLGVVVDGTGANLATITKMNDKLKSLGYETGMVFVNANIETALHRNTKRARSVPEEIAIQKWKEVQSNVGHYQNMFSTFFVIDNSEGSETFAQIDNVYKKVSSWCGQKPKNPIAIADIQRMKSERGL